MTLTKKKDDAQVSGLLAELEGKGFNPDYVVSKVATELDDAAARRVPALLKSAS